MMIENYRCLWVTIISHFQTVQTLVSDESINNIKKDMNTLIILENLKTTLFI